MRHLLSVKLLLALTCTSVCSLYRPRLRELVQQNADKLDNLQTKLDNVVSDVAGIQDVEAKVDTLADQTGDIQETQIDIDAEVDLLVNRTADIRAFLGQLAQNQGQQLRAIDSGVGALNSRVDGVVKALNLQQNGNGHPAGNGNPAG